jgi:hypothetical protein
MPKTDTEKATDAPLEQATMPSAALCEAMNRIMALEPEDIGIELREAIAKAGVADAQLFYLHFTRALRAVSTRLGSGLKGTQDR